jgi:YbgC/YbaW family acyl-CoA thioester hydrolase
MATSKFSKSFTVRFNETDLSGLVHHSKYFHWLEETEYAMLRSLGEAVVGQIDSEGLIRGWPRKELNMKFHLALYHEDQIRVDLKIKGIRAAGLIYEADFYRITESGEELTTQASYKTTYCVFDTLRKVAPKSLLINESLLKQIEPYKQ